MGEPYSTKSYIYSLCRDRVADERTATHTHQRGPQGPIPAYFESLPAGRAASQLTDCHHQPQGETGEQKLEKGPTNHGRLWLTEYISNLMERIKWTRNERVLHLTDLVLVDDKTSERETDRLEE